MQDRARQPGRARWRTSAVVGGSTLLHLVVLGVMAIRAAGPIAPDIIPPETILLEIEPRPRLNDERTRPVATPPPQPASIATPPAGNPVIRAVTAARSHDEDEEQPARTAPEPADGWRVSRETPAPGWPPARSGGPLGLPGRLSCHLRAGLTAEQQARCDQAFGQAAARAAPITGTGDPARDARMTADGARAMARHEAQRSPLSGGVGVMGPADCVGSNFGTGCAGAHLGGVPGVDMNQGASTNIRQRSNKLD